MLIPQELSQFYGTEAYHRFSPLFPSVVLTDGAAFVARNGGTQGAFWLMDAIASYQSSLQAQPFQCWTLKTNLDTRRATLTAEDGNDRELVRQEIEYTDFDMPEFSLWVEMSKFSPSSPLLSVILLPSEH